MDIGTRYNHIEIERSVEENFSYKIQLTKRKKLFSMVIPPPNITGSLHIGHALNMTLQDIVVRFKRMLGYEVLWVPGTDHAGIATQHVVSKEIEKRGLKREKMGREEFLKFVEEWKKESQKRIREQMKKLGLSVNWAYERFTMDEEYKKAVSKAFKELYEKKLIYKGDRIISWCPKCGTALSDLEVELKDVKGKIYKIRYPGVDFEGVVVATTRPETLLGDTAVAVNPYDERYNKLIGREVIVPIVQRNVKVIADSAVDMNFGTGVLKITPYHDFQDFEIAKRHNLPGIKVIDEKGFITFPPYQGLERFEAREKIVEDLKASNLLEGVEEYNHKVGMCYRCGTIVEPMQSKQWFLKVKDLAKKAIEVVKKGEIKFIPKHWENTYFSWMENIRDWCISRQIWWGHRIPIVRCKCGKERVEDVEGENKNVCPNCNYAEYENDVLDTWFSSALWPFAVLGWPKETTELKNFYPTSLLVTGFDIIFFWVARMIMMGIFFTGKVPFREVYIHALVRDEKGQKMSKTRGNVLDPIEIIDKYGSDALRFTLAMLSAQGRDIKLSEKNIESGRRFLNKLWNSARFVIMNTTDIKKKCSPKSLPQQWIMIRSYEVVEEVRRNLEEYKFNNAIKSIYEFFWGDFCDWYIEISKEELEDEKLKDSAKSTLLDVLEISLKLLHPFIPSITEFLWKKLGKESLIAFEPFPEPIKTASDPLIKENMNEIIKMINEIRAIKSELDIHQKTNVMIFSENQKILNSIKENISWISKLSQSEITILTVEEFPENYLITSSGKITVGIKFEGEKKTEKFEREIEEIKREIEKINRKLMNPLFLEKADLEEIEESRKKLQEFITRVEYLEKRIKMLKK